MTDDSKPKVFTVTLADQKAGPDRLAELATQARAAGAEIVLERTETNTERRLREWNDDPLIPRITRGDDRSFLKNLDRIARGDLRVVHEVEPTLP